MKTKIIALVGMCGSGKSVAGDELENLGYTRVYFGGITMEELKKRNMKINEDNERQIREQLRRDHGMGAFALLSLPKIDTLLAGNKKVYIDGLYSWSEYLELMRKYGENIILIEIYADKKKRYSRLEKRSHRPLTVEKARERDIKEIENIEKGGLIAFSDYKIENNDEIDHLKQRLHEVLEELQT